LKILYISQGARPDYLCDMVAHGLKSLFGADVVDVNRLSYLYKGADTSNLYGRGFTLYGLLDEGEVDRSDIPAKIKARFLDLIVFGSVQRCYEMLHEVMVS